MKPYIIVALICLVVLSGCSTEQQQNWSLSVNGHLEEAAEGHIFQGEVRLGGHLGGVEVHGVQVRFLDDTNETIELVQVGTLNDSSSAVNLSVDLQDRPIRVLVEVRDIDTPDNADYGVAGLRYQDGGYYPYTDYNPYIED